MPAGGVQLTLLAFTGFITLRYRNTRFAMMILMCVLSFTGALLVMLLDRQNKVGLLIGVYMTTALSVNTPLVLSLVSSNIAGFTKRATVSSMLFLAYAAGNLAGPQLFLTKEAPVYQVSL